MPHTIFLNLSRDHISYIGYVLYELLFTRQVRHTAGL